MTRWSPTPADLLTLSRVALLPGLWALAAHGAAVALGVGIAIAGLTDVLDGPVARATGRSSRLGSQLDSVADLLLMGSIVVWLAWLQPSFFQDNRVPLLVWLGIGSASILATYVRYRRLGNLHLYSAKTAGVVGYLFVVWLFVTGGYSPVFFAVTIGLAIVAATETLLVALARRDATERTGSLLSRRS